MSSYELPQSINVVAIDGILSEVNLTKDKGDDGIDRVRGSVTIAVDQTYGNNVEHEEIVVNVFAKALKNDKKSPNPAYKSICALEDMRRISVDGDKADKVRFNSGTIQENAFIPSGGTNVVSSWRISNSFFQKVQGELTPQAIFKNRVFIRSIDPEVVNDEETGRLVIKGVLVGYGGAAHVITYYVEDPRAVDFMMKNWNVGDTVDFGGRIRCAAGISKGMTMDFADSFGEELNITSGTVRELVITSGSRDPLPTEEAFDEGAIRLALNNREAYIKANAAKSQSSKKSAARGW